MDAVEVISNRPEVKLSCGNIKLGDIPNLNLSLQSCPSSFSCRKTCYNLKAQRLYPNAIRIWETNFSIWKSSPERFFETIYKSLVNKNYSFFRWHSCGEIPNQSYLDGMIELANKLPEIRFLSFTKRYSLDYSQIPKNLCMIFSAWPEMKLPVKISKNFPVAWFQDKDGVETRIKRYGKNPQPCAKKCSHCHRCWFLNDVKQDVIFMKH